MRTEQLIDSVRDLIRREGPISFARFMELSLYHPEHGYYSSGRAAIGRRGDYFTSVSVGPLFGRMMATQFAEIWRKLDRPNDFVIVEQGAHHGEFARDVLEVLQKDHPDLFADVHYMIVEPFPVLRKRQEGRLGPFAARMEWTDSLETMAPFSGIHFSNELLDAMPVHLAVFLKEENQGCWYERFVESGRCGFTFVERPVSTSQLRDRLANIPEPAATGYETEISLAAHHWVKALAAKLQRGVVLIADYGFTRAEFFDSSRRTGTLQSYSAHHTLSSPLEEVGEHDISSHVEWTSLAECAERNGLRVIGFTDQHHFLTGLLSSQPRLASVTETGRALQTLIHPELLGTKFQFLGLTKNLPANVSLSGFRFARDAVSALGIE
jgi:SAM-dependent MidA family methyltransferase